MYQQQISDIAYLPSQRPLQTNLSQEPSVYGNSQRKNRKRPNEKDIADLILPCLERK